LELFAAPLAAAAENSRLKGLWFLRVSMKGVPSVKTMRAAPQHIVITGASSGIGAALVRIYSRPGTRLSLIARDRSRLEDIAGQGQSHGSSVDVHTVDVTDAPAMEGVLIACDSKRAVDLVIANAGIGDAMSMAPNTGESGDIARRIFATNTLGVVNTVTPLLSRFIARRSGQIAIMSSLGAFLGLPDCPAYSASKAAIRAYGEALRRLVAPHGVRITVVCPGFVDTPMSASLPFRGPFMWSAERAAEYIARGIARGKGEVLFPWPLGMGARILSALPLRLADRILTRLRVGA
jgi:short-subunit dehydrogenase